MVSRDPQMVDVCTALATGMPREQASATFSKTSGVPLLRSSPSTGSTTQPGQHGRYEAAHLSCRTSTMTISWRRHSLFCSHQDFTQICPFIPTSPFAWGSSATCCSSCKTHTLATSTLPSQVSHGCVRTNTVLWFPAPPTNRSARRFAFENLRHELEVSRRSPGHRVSTHLRGHRRQVRAGVPRRHCTSQKALAKVVAVGRLSVARSDQRDPRLSLDSTIPNVNAKVLIEEQSFNPCVEDIASAKVVSHSSEGGGLTIDVSKAHKRLRIREDECGFLLFQHRGKPYHYTVCHFGARFSAAW